MKRIVLICGGHSAGRTEFVRAVSKVMAEHDIPFEVIKERLSGVADSPGFHVLLERMNINPSHYYLPEVSQKELPDLDEPKNWLSTEPPKQKKFRSYQPDKRALNRKNRKRK